MAKKEKRRVSIYNDVSKDFFESEVIPKREPALLRGLEIGRAREKWTPEYLAENGSERTVKIHVCPTGKMDFIHKNFTYKTLPFNQFVKRASEDIHEEYFVCPEEKYYLRSLGDDPRKV